MSASVQVYESFSHGFLENPERQSSPLEGIGFSAIIIRWLGSAHRKWGSLAWDGWQGNCGSGWLNKWRLLLLLVMGLYPVLTVASHVHPQQAPLKVSVASLVVSCGPPFTMVLTSWWSSSSQDRFPACVSSQLLQRKVATGASKWVTRIPCWHLSAPIASTKVFSSLGAAFTDHYQCEYEGAGARLQVNVPRAVQDCISSACWVVMEPVPSLSLSMCLGRLIPVVLTLFHAVRRKLSERQHLWQPYLFHYSSWQLHHAASDGSMLPFDLSAFSRFHPSFLSAENTVLWQYFIALSPANRQ